jgi:hypothetical protein
MEAVLSSKMSATLYKTIRHHFPGSNAVHSHRCENLQVTMTSYTSACRNLTELTRVYCRIFLQEFLFCLNISVVKSKLHTVGRNSDRLCGLVVRVLATDPEVLVSIPGPTRFSEKYGV